MVEFRLHTNMSAMDGVSFFVYEKKTKRRKHWENHERLSKMGLSMLRRLVQADTRRSSKN